MTERPLLPLRAVRGIALGLAGIAALLQLACTLPAATRPGSEHPLLGKIWDVNAGRMVPRESLLQDVDRARIVLLGEVHDNPEHHRLQAEVLRAVLARGRRPVLAMEQFDRGFQPAIDAAQAGGAASADAVATAGALDRAGWVWPLYEPLVRIAIDARLPVVAINLSRQQTREVARQGFAALGATAARDLSLDVTLTPAQQAIMDAGIVDGHCGKMPAAMLPRMINIQRARDATMADALIARAAAGAVVIAGAEHVRRDVGVPVYLARRVPDQRVLSIGFVEIDADDLTVEDYVRPPASALPFDYVWFTTRAEREDPCKDLQMPNRP